VGAEWLRELRERTLAWGVKEVRGRGLMVGVELEGGSARALRVARKLLEQGWIVLTGGADGATLTLTPALDVDEALLSAFAVTLSEVLEHD
jgi:4-aminobutyrate aminotransferase-like enzyme